VLEIGHYSGGKDDSHELRSNGLQSIPPLTSIIAFPNELGIHSFPPMEVLNFGHVNARNATVYSVKIFGIPGFQSSITVVHEFYGVFRVTSMLTRILLPAEHSG
jgi:hypothetical protein